MGSEDRLLRLAKEASCLTWRRWGRAGCLDCLEVIGLGAELVREEWWVKMAYRPLRVKATLDLVQIFEDVERREAALDTDEAVLAQLEDKCRNALAQKEVSDGR